MNSKISRAELDAMKEKQKNLSNSTKQEDVLSPLQIALKKFKKNKIAVAGLIIFILIVLAVIFVPIISGVDMNHYDLSAKNQGPSLEHWFGTDAQGRDVFFRTFYGGRISILVGVISALMTVLLGIIVGGIAGFYGGIIDNLLMRFAEIVSALPFTPMIIALAAVMLWTPQNTKMFVISFLIGVLSWPGLARLIRGQILTLREQEFMQACNALGISDFAKIFKHLIPNVISLIIVNATLSMAGAILTEAGLSFLGMGVVQPTPSWGNLMNLAQSVDVLKNYPWQWFPAGILCIITVVSINLFGEGLRDALDPKDVC